jgi:hypothetical protein
LADVLTAAVVAAGFALGSGGCLAGTFFGSYFLGDIIVSSIISTSPPFTSSSGCFFYCANLGGGFFFGGAVIPPVPKASKSSKLMLYVPRGNGLSSPSPSTPNCYGATFDLMG